MKKSSAIILLSLLINFSLQAFPGQEYLNAIVHHVQQNKGIYAAATLVVVTAAGAYMMYDPNENSCECECESTIPNSCPPYLAPNWEIAPNGQPFVHEGYLEPSVRIDCYFWVRGCVNGICDMSGRLHTLLENLRYYAEPIVSNQSILQILPNGNKFPECDYDYVRGPDIHSSRHGIGWVTLRYAEEPFDVVPNN